MLSPQLRDDRIEVSIGPNGLRRTYCCEGIRTATVYRMAGRWWVRCYFGPDDSDSVRYECGTPDSGEATASAIPSDW
jgi:hypothetical protein